ncbi:rod shape-determining protein MreD [Salinicoccus carnicancri]|uniref:rod shape-determining protein MreD n=1 Tax=Salinicoccus carnicancri TaxID=558170 RepID=UPI0002E1D744|nr:rod shape-determining protein MreD [Salinicoccus carnicancri]
MKAIIIFLFSLLFMYLDFLFAEFSPVMVSGLEVYFVPRLLLMYVLLISIYVSPSMSAFIGIVTGLMLDVYIGSVYGVHAFGMVAFVAFMHTAFRVFYKDFVAMAFVILLLTFLYETYIYFIYRVLDLVYMPIFDYLALRAAPSLLLNALLFFFVFVIALKTSKVRNNLRSRH